MVCLVYTAKLLNEELSNLVYILSGSSVRYFFCKDHYLICWFNKDQNVCWEFRHHFIFSMCRVPSGHWGSWFSTIRKKKQFYRIFPQKYFFYFTLETYQSIHMPLRVVNYSPSCNPYPTDHTLLASWFTIVIRAVYV